MSPDAHLDAAAITGQHFATVRRGFDPGEVRAYLHQLSEAVGRLHQTEAELLARVAQADARVAQAESLDEERLVELLGEETTRVLSGARGAAADIRQKAQEAAARLISQANDEAHQVRGDAEATVAAQRAEMIDEVEALRADASQELDRRRTEANELVAQMRREAEAECDGLRREADQVRVDAIAEGESLRGQAQDEGRQMIMEAQLVRERILRDLARRRKISREQLERLNAARDRLIAAYEVVRRTVAEATTELQVAMPEAKLAGEQAMRRVRAEPEPTVDELEGQVAMARVAGLLEPMEITPALYDQESDDEELLADLVEEEAAAADVVEAPEIETEVGDEPVVAEEPAVVDVVDVVSEVEAEVAEVEAEVAEVEAEVAEVEAEVAEVEVEVAEAAADPGEDEEVDEDEETEDDETEDEDYELPAVAESDVDALFARLRVQGEAAVAVLPDVVEVEVMEVADYEELVAVEAEASDAEPEPHPQPDPEPAVAEYDEIDLHLQPGVVVPRMESDEVLLRQRDDALASVERDLTRRLKRALADEQNEVLDLLRRAKPATVEELFPTVATHAARYTDAAREELSAAAAWGAIHVADSDPQIEGTCDALAAELGQTVVDPLRERVGRSFSETGGDLGELTDRLRALYREWKGQRIADAVRHYTSAAYAQGAYDAVPARTPLRWIVDRGGDPCPDADDNALAGAVCKGEGFPTGDHCPPAHLGCRCLVVPTAE